MSAQQPQGRFAIVNGRLILPQEVVAGKAVRIEEGRILGLAGRDELGAEVAEVDVGGRYVAPGLVDIHTHGALNHSFNEPTAEAYSAIVEENARRGVTSLLATLATAPIPDLVRCLDFAHSWMQGGHGGARVLGVHLESPYISPAQKGALDPENIRRPDDGSAEILLERAAALRILVLAPERPGALALVERLARRGIIPAAGHSSARDEDVLAAMKVGLRHVTHIWSGMSSTVREGPWRKPGLLESALVFDGLTVEMISDGKHLPPTLMRLAYKCIGPDRLCAVSDATNGAGLPEGARFRMGGMEYDVSGGVGMLLDRTAFAGSTTLGTQMIPVLVDSIGTPLPEAIRMLTLTPARAIGVEGSRGSLEAGKDADLVILDEGFAVWRTMIGGRWVED